MGDWMIPKEAVAEIARLRAELANARLERDNIASLNSSLIAELAAKDARIAHERVEGDKILAALEAANVRIAELEKSQPTFDECMAYVARAERAEARIAELEGGKAGWEVEGFIDRLTRRDDSNSERLVFEAISHLRGFSRDCDALRARAALNRSPLD